MISISFSKKLIFMFILVIIFSFAGITVSSKTFTLRYSDNDPLGGLRTDFLKEVWFPEIVKQTNGQVEIQDFWGGAIFGGPDSLKGCSDGVSDMTIIFTSYYPTQLPTFQSLWTFARAPEKFENLAWVYQQIFEQIPQFSKDLEKWNQKLLLVTVGLPMGLMASYPIDGVEDVVGKKWRTSSSFNQLMLENIGAIPVSIPWDDVYMSLSTGTIDGDLTAYDAQNMMKFYEAAPNILVGTKLWWPEPFMQTINLDKWNSLPEDVQEGIIEAGRIAIGKFAEIYDGLREKIIQKHRDYGCTVTLMDEDDVKLIADEEFYSKMRNDWIKEATEKYGIEDAGDIINRLKLILDEGIAREENG